MHLFRAKPRQGRQMIAHGASRGTGQAHRTSPGGAEEKAFLPPLTGLIAATFDFPRLTPWANFWRPYGAFQGNLS
jgi:hypothetical protein